MYNVEIKLIVLTSEMLSLGFINISKLDYSYDNGRQGMPLYVLNYPDSDMTMTDQVATVVIYMVIFVVGMPGNLLVLWVTSYEAHRSINAIWFLNLAVADLLSCLALPIHITTILMHGNWILGDTACPVLTALFAFNLYASVLLLATISTDRFLIVFRPIWCKKYRVAQLAWLASGVAWMLAMMLSIPSFSFGVVYEDPISERVFCGVALELRGEQVERALTITLFVLTFLVPLVTMSVCYTFLLLQTWASLATRSTKTLKVVVAVVTSFFVFWLPYQLSRMLLVLLPRSSPIWNMVSSQTLMWMALAYVNCCVNPIIYVAASWGLRIRVFKFLPGQLHELLTDE
ncbi:LOW QUALITY PROTEIN: C5a anaphylatoxin chemotactic receptor 1-like [Suncus etruscus]|uniref:LOW QUALITY PROTEIN: C5a anaphylatoxin chemotactic receptor 1-like n=1 Tax=Suncus etruscus TaxID=109475 RepID=UPI002110106B|nr:LOW QUALITY PROTEIN: C5a anaphylatoxin chemotactic receptor 1-like [Suncus etruscus]